MRATTALLLGALLTTVALSGCINPDQAPGPIPFETVAKGQGSDITEPRTLVIREFGAWGDLWLEHHPGEQDGSIAIPAINFTERMVIAVFQGEQPNICHEVTIENLTLTAEGSLIVDGTRFTAPEDAVCGEALVRPFHIVSAPAVDAPVEFQLDQRPYATDPGDPGDDPGDADEPPSTNVTFETIAQGGDSGLETRQELVIREDESWQALWENHTARHSNPPPAPEIDFSQQMVLAVFKGQSPDGCHRAKITEVTESPNGSYRVNASYFKVEAGACTLAITYPFHMVSVPHDPDPVTFQTTDGTRQQGDGGQDGNGTSGDGTEQTTVSFETLDHGSRSSIEARDQVVIRDGQAWQALWENHTAHRQPPPDRPQVAFAEAIVVAVFKGTSPDGCHGAEITNTTLETREDGATQLLVEATFFRIEGAACTQGQTQPFHIVEVPVRPDEVAFDAVEEERQA